MRNRWLSGIGFAGWLLGCAAGGNAEKTAKSPSPAAETPGSDLSVLRIVLKAGSEESGAGDVAASLLVTDPEKRRSGADPKSDRVLTEIPGSTYEDEAIEDPEEPGSGEGWRVLEIQRPSAGTYRLEVRGATDARYDLSLRAYDTKGEPEDREWTGLPIQGGETHVFVLQYSPAPGDGFRIQGGFDGEEEGGAEGDQVLTYANISGRRTVLPAPAASVALFVVYGENFDPRSFRAAWNDMDAAPRFTPLPGSCQVVTLPVRPGENKLVLHASGRSGPGRTAVETDSLVWVVPGGSGR